MEEQYIVRLDYKKPDGYWVIGHEMEISVLTDVDHEKENHFVAEAKAKEMYPGCRVTCVTYC